MRAKVLEFCQQEELFQPGDRVICALSGGADSVALLHLLHSMQQELGICLEAAHFNHCLRGEDSQRDAEFVRQFCAQLGINCHMGQGDVNAHAQQTGQSAELAARELRYAFFASLPCDRIATAHTADDNTETVLQHLLRGSGLRGLSGIPPKRGRLVRPFLSLTREEIEVYLEQNGLCHVEDATNAQDFCLRNRLRHRVIPPLKDEMPELHAQVLRQSRLLRREDAFLDSLAEEVLRSAQREEGWDCETLLGAHPVVQARALRLMLRSRYPQDLSLRHIQSIQLLLASSDPSARISLPSGFIACRRYGILSVTETETPLVFPLTELKIPGETIIEDVGLKICCFFCEKFQNFANTPFHFAVKYDMISQSRIYLRARQQGDRILTDGGHHKSLKKLFVEKKIPRHLRQRLPVITTGKEILAAAGVGVSSEYRARAGESALIISIEI